MNLICVIMWNICGKLLGCFWAYHGFCLNCDYYDLRMSYDFEIMKKATKEGFVA